MTEDNGNSGEKLEESAEQLELGEDAGEAGSLDLGGEETVGELLLSTREKSGLTLEVVSQETKIPVPTLQYLETDNFEAIPAKVYATGFLRTYSRVLGLDPAQVINKYEVQTGQTHKSRGDLWEIEEEIVEEKLDSPHLLWKLVIPVVLVVAAIFILFKVFGGGEEVKPPPSLPEAGVQGAAVENREVTGPAEEGTGPAGSAGGEEEKEETAAGQAEAVPVPAERPPAEPAAPGEMTLRITAEERIWFDLLILERTSEGIDTTATDFILEPGESRTFTANDSFFIRKIGKTEGFSIELDGRPYEVPVVEGRLPRDITISRDR